MHMCNGIQQTEENFQLLIKAHIVSYMGGYITGEKIWKQVQKE